MRCAAPLRAFVTASWSVFYALSPAHGRVSRWRAAAPPVMTLPLPPLPEGWLAAVRCCVTHGTDTMMALLLKHGAPYARQCGREGPVSADVLEIIVGGDRLGMLQLALTAMAADDDDDAFDLMQSNSSNSASPAGALLATQERDSLFYLACERGHVNLVKWFIEVKWSSVTARNANGMTPLHVCAERGHTAIAGMLLGTAPALGPADEGASSAVVCKSEMLSLVDNLGRSPVLIAVEKGHTGLNALFSSALRA